MPLFAAVRGISVLLLGGTLVGFVPQIESPFAGAPGQETSRDVAEEGAARSLARDRKAAADDQTSSQRTVQVAAADDASPPKSSKSKDHVKAKVFLSVDKLPAGEKCKFVVVLDVEERWHIQANPASQDNLIPTKVTVESKLKSKQLETKYPEGTEFATDDAEMVSVYEGEVLIRGEIQAATDAAGKKDELEFQVKYQACDKKNCLPPKTIKLPGQLPIVKAGTPVKQINQKYFPKK